MHKYAYQAKDRPEQKLNIREAAAKPFMGLTAFLRHNEPWLVIGYDGKNHILESREGNTVKLNTPFNWVEATDKSRLVAAMRSEGSSIPGTPHYSFEDSEWYIRIEDGIYDAEDILHEIEKTSDVYENPTEGDSDELREQLEGYPDYQEDVPDDECTLCGSKDNYQYPENDPTYPGAYECQNINCSEYRSTGVPHHWMPEGNSEGDLGDMYDEQGLDAFGPPRQAHQTQKEKSRKDEKSEPLKCPKCKSHTKGNRIAEFTDEGKPKFHCKSCGHTYEGKGVVVNPKLTYQVDDGQGREDGISPYAPGPDDPKKVCPGCGYSWKKNHKFQVGDKTCSECGSTPKEDSQEDVQAMEGGDGYKNPKRSDFTDPNSDYLGNPSGVAVTQPVTERLHTDISNGSMNVTAPIESLPVQQTSQIDMNQLPAELKEELQRYLQAAASVEEDEFDQKIARKAFTPGEQKSLIDEGMGNLARNHSKLNLENTHYITRQLDDDPHTSLW